MAAVAFVGGAAGTGLSSASRASRGDAEHSGVHAGSFELAPVSAHARAQSDRMARVPAGSFRPFFKTNGSAIPVRVRAFLLDASPVSRADFLAFVHGNPAWRKSRARPLFAENTYLHDWPADLDPTGPSLDVPVTFVTWFAARAYCRAQGKRLPTLIEWEHAAEVAAASDQPRSAQPSGLELAMRQARSATLAFGAVWEWTDDFDSTLVSERRAALRPRICSAARERALRTPRTTPDSCATRFAAA
jgi:formylglycine-generating enzyme required for sulfatase activity